MLDRPVLVLCGGLGTRLRPAVADRPKALAPVGREPFLAMQLKALRARGARHFVLCVGHMADQIDAAFGNGAGLGARVDYSRDGEALRGTAGALKRAERFFAPSAVVVNVDTYIDVDLRRLARVHDTAKGARGAVATLTLAVVPAADRFGAVELDASGRVCAFREKRAGAGGWANAGVYVIERALLDRVPANVPASLECEVFPRALLDGLELASLPHQGPFRDIGTPDDLRAFVRERESAHAA
ncbi:MAG: sugar phosphate nucleotidyltransferase [Gemmata sp.]